MGVVRCPKGHFYDNIKFPKCPYCGETIEEDRTVAFAHSFGNASRHADSKTIALKQDKNEVRDEDHTVGLYAQKKGLDYIAGWLVCIEGNEKGRDYRIHQGFNRIGRDYSNDIVIEDTSLPENKSMCAIVYDDRSNQFFVVEQREAEVYLNGEPVSGATPLTSAAVLTIGNGKYEFVPFCREGRTW